MNTADFRNLKKTFILGVERSGSTWLANLFDSHPATSVFLEPFAQTAHLFHGFPDRLTYLNRAGTVLRRQLRERLAELPYYKNFGLERRNAPEWLKRLNWSTQSAVGKFLEWLGTSTVGPSRAYRELNFNRAANPEVIGFEKLSPQTHFVIKEVRLNFKVGMLHQLVPDAQFVVIVRNPLSQVESILRQFQQDTLVFLRQFLTGFIEAIEGQERFSRFIEAFRLLEDNLFSRALAYWFVNYAILLEDLKRTDASFCLVRHESLCDAPEARIQELFSWTDLCWAAQCGEYLRHSTQREPCTPNPTETSRQSRSYHLRALRRIDAETREKFWHHSKPFWSLLPTEIASYREWLDEPSRCSPRDTEKL